MATSARAPDCPLVSGHLEVPGSVVTIPTLTFPIILPNQAPVDANTTLLAAPPLPLHTTQKEMAILGKEERVEGISHKAVTLDWCCFRQ